MKYNRAKKGFTLIEMLIVIAIIGILASIVLVGLGPVQRRGRDARRQSDLRGIQNALELYYNKCGRYPGTETCGSQQIDFSDLEGVIEGADLGVNNLPNDPSSGQNYFYGSNGPSYVIGARMEDANNPALLDEDEPEGTVYGVDCDDPVYCITF